MSQRVVIIMAICCVLFLLFAVTRPARADDLTVGLVACYDLEESSGSRADSWSTNHLTDNNTVGSNTGIVGTAASLVATNSEWLSIADNPAMSLGTDTDFTLAAWVYPTSASTNIVVMDKGINSGQNRLHEMILYRVDTNSFTLSVGNNAGFGSVTNPLSTSINTWYFVVAWHDAAADTIYLQVNNGTPSSASWTGGTQDTTGSFVLGRYGDLATFYMDGRIDQAVYWKSLVGTSDRTWLYNSGAGRDCDDIAGTAPTPTPTFTPTPSQTPTGTPVPTITPTPGPKIDYIDLPGGGRGEIIHSISAGEAAIAAVGMVLVLFAIYWLLSQWARAAGAK